MTTLRPAVAADAASMLRLTARLAAFPVPAHRRAGEIELADHAILQQAIAHPSPESLLLVSDAGDRLLGFVFATTRRDYFTGEPHAHIEILAVAEGVEGQGIGRALMEGAEAWAQGRGYAQVTLNVFATNARARAVYHRLGYEPELVRYRKALAPQPPDTAAAGSAEASVTPPGAG